MSGGDFRQSGLGERVVVGILAGIILALFYSVILAVSLATGRASGTLESLGISPVLVVVIYASLCPGLGALVGIALPIGRSRFGAGVLGFFAAFVFYAAFAFLTMPGLSNPTVLFGTIVMLAILSIVTGVVTGLFLWSEPTG